jgi:signal transduction histidine kinase
MFRPITRRQLIADVVIALVLVLVGYLPAIAYNRSGAEVFTLIGLAGALALRRLSPGLSLGAAWLVALVEMAIGINPIGPSNLIILAVLYATSAYGNRVVRWLGFSSAFLGAACVGIYTTVVIRGVDTSISGIVAAIGSAAFAFGAAVAGFLLAWTVGLLVATWRRGRQSQAQVAQAEREVVAEQERTRIARDMHDVVAHSLAVVIAQADGARYLRSTQPEAVDEALQTIAGTAREALADVRVLLAQLRHTQGDAPQPALHDLDRLYTQLRAAGLDLRVETTGEAMPLGTSTQLAVYRIVQESLTNALRHGDPAAEVLVRFDWTATGLHLSVSNTVRAPSTHPGGPLGHGHGLAGMTERASLVGGSLSAKQTGPVFVVRAWLPGGLTGALPLALLPEGTPAP